MPGGVFDKDKETVKSNVPEMHPESGKQATSTKVDFQGPEKMLHKQSSQIAENTQKNVKKTAADTKIDNLNQSLSGSAEQKQLEEEFDNIEKVSAEDLILAEELLFKGYAEKTFKNPNFENMSYTMCTTNADDVAIVDEMVFELAKKNEDSEGLIDLPESVIKNTRNIYTLALSYKGDNGADICTDKVSHLSIIKKAISKLSEYEVSGDIKGFKELRDSIKKSILKRSIEIRKRPTPIIDMLSNAKYKFDNTMYRIMDAKGILPKS